MAKAEHIRVRRYGGLYTHHGIDLGDGTVVHFSGEPTRLRHAEVRRDTLADFAQGEPVEVVLHGAEIRDPDDIVATALAHVGERGYCIWRRNCEHFATYCVTGRAESAQIRFVQKVGAVASVAAATTIVLGSALWRASRGRHKRSQRA